MKTSSQFTIHDSEISLDYDDDGVGIVVCGPSHRDAIIRIEVVNGSLHIIIVDAMSGETKHTVVM